MILFFLNSAHFFHCEIIYCPGELFGTNFIFVKFFSTDVTSKRNSIEYWSILAENLKRNWFTETFLARSSSVCQSRNLMILVNKISQFVYVNLEAKIWFQKNWFFLWKDFRMLLKAKKMWREIFWKKNLTRPNSLLCKRILQQAKIIIVA